MKLHKVKEKINRKGKYYSDVICDGKVYSADKNGFVNLPISMENKNVKPVTVDEVKKAKNDSDKSLSEMTIKELKEIAKNNKRGKNICQ